MLSAQAQPHADMGKSSPTASKPTLTKAARAGMKWPAPILHSN